MLKHLPAIIAFLAPSVVSYDRLIPHRWSAAFNNLGAQDREAAIRLCPIRGTDPATAEKQFNFEIRASDAAASPHLALAAIVMAGTAGIEAGLEAPEATAEDLSDLSEADLAARNLRRLPSSLAAALDELEAAGEVRSWFPKGFVDIYLAHKTRRSHQSRRQGRRHPLQGLSGGLLKGCAPLATGLPQMCLVACPLHLILNAFEERARNSKGIRASCREGSGNRSYRTYH